MVQQTHHLLICNQLESHVFHLLSVYGLNLFPSCEYPSRDTVYSRLISNIRVDSSRLKVRNQAFKVFNNLTGNNDLGMQVIP